jgi:PleD family two-component response regulator
VRELTELHCGEVTVESTEGVWTTFTVMLRGGSAHLPPEQVREALRWLERSDAAVGDADELGPVADAEAARAGRIFVVDDNEDMRRHLVRILAPRFEVIAHPDGQAALEAALADRPDLVLTDVMMPRLDGFGLLSALRGDSRTSTVPVIILSARAGDESAVEGIAAGADD